MVDGLGQPASHARGFPPIAAVRLVTAPVSHVHFESSWQPPMLVRLLARVFFRETAFTRPPEAFCRYRQASICLREGAGALVGGAKRGAFLWLCGIHRRSGVTSRRHHHNQGYLLRRGGSGRSAGPVRNLHAAPSPPRLDPSRSELRQYASCAHVARAMRRTRGCFFCELSKPHSRGRRRSRRSASFGFVLAKLPLSSPRIPRGFPILDCPR
jgi:hypothetical protein